MKMKQLFMIIFIMIFMLTVIGCDNRDPGAAINKGLETTPPGQITTLRFINSWGGSDPKSETLQTVFNAFMIKNPDIYVTNESLYGEDFLVKLKSDFASGNDPDVFGLWPGSDIKTLVNVGKVADLSGVLAEDPAWKESFDPKMWQYTTFNDSIYGLPVELIFEGLFINTDLFFKYDVPVPTNYEELKSAVVKFHENGVIPIAFNCKSEGTYLYQNMAMMLGGKTAIENPIQNGTIDPCYITALNRLRELYELGAFPTDLYTMTSVERNNLFRDKKAAMIVQGSWYVSAITDDDSVEIIPFPEMQEGGSEYSTMVYGLGGGTFYMSSRAWDDPVKKEASLKLLRYLTSEETAAYFAEGTGMLSCVDISGSAVSYSKLAKSGVDFINKAKNLVGPPDSFLPRTTWENVIVTYLPYVLEGRMTPEELWNRALSADTASGE